MYLIRFSYFQVNLILPCIFLITCSFLVISSFFVSLTEVGIGTAIILGGIPVYYGTIHRPIPCLTKLSQTIYIFCVKLFMCMPNEDKIEWFRLCLSPVNFSFSYLNSKQLSHPHTNGFALIILKFHIQDLIFYAPINYIRSCSNRLWVE